MTLTSDDRRAITACEHGRQRRKCEVCALIEEERITSIYERALRQIRSFYETPGAGKACAEIAAAALEEAERC